MLVGRSSSSRLSAHGRNLLGDGRSGWPCRRGESGVGMNLYDILEQRARQQPSHPAILGPEPEDCVTYAALLDGINSASRRLRFTGVGAGATVGLHCPSGASYIIANYAAWRCGACVVPIPVELAPPEKFRILQTVKTEFVITQDGSRAFLDS